MIVMMFGFRPSAACAGDGGEQTLTPIAPIAALNSNDLIFFHFNM